MPVWKGWSWTCLLEFKEKGGTRWNWKPSPTVSTRLDEVVTEEREEAQGLSPQAPELQEAWKKRSSKESPKGLCEGKEGKPEEHKQAKLNTNRQMSKAGLQEMAMISCSCVGRQVISQHPLLQDCCHSVAKSCLTLCDPMDCSTPGYPVLHYLQEFAQTHVRWVGDAIQPSHPLLLPPLPALNLSQHQSFFPMSWLFASDDQSIGTSLYGYLFLIVQILG